MILSICLDTVDIISGHSRLLVLFEFYHKKHSYGFILISLLAILFTDILERERERERERDRERESEGARGRERAREREREGERGTSSQKKRFVKNLEEPWWPAPHMPHIILHHYAF